MEDWEIVESTLAGPHAASYKVTAWCGAPFDREKDVGDWDKTKCVACLVAGARWRSPTGLWWVEPFQRLVELGGERWAKQILGDAWVP